MELTLVRALGGRAARESLRSNGAGFDAGKRGGVTKKKLAQRQELSKPYPLGKQTYQSGKKKRANQNERGCAPSTLPKACSKELGKGARGGGSLDENRSIDARGSFVRINILDEKNSMSIESQVKKGNPAEGGTRPEDERALEGRKGSKSRKKRLERGVLHCTNGEKMISTKTTEDALKDRRRREHAKKRGKKSRLRGWM